MLQTLLIILTASAFSITLGRAIDHGPFQMPKVLRGWRVWLVLSLVLLAITLLLKQ